MKIGDVVESALWLDGNEKPEQLTRFKQEVRGAINLLCTEQGFIPGEIIFTEKRPEEDRVPEVPDHIQGDRVRLLVAEAELVDEVKVHPNKGSFIGELDKKDLDLLRKVTRKAYANQYGTLIGNKTCDELIEALGVDAALATLH